ncbi:anthranilate synthase component I [Actinomadura sp. KC216]|uniref:anthranilate synthase component I n=1 Tax=Actinomadura sp. KC216 TaxID=2530370 RepID=UPI00326066C7
MEHKPIVPGWQPGTWRNKPVAQQPEWPDAAAVADAERRLLQLPPLVTPEECRALTAALAEVASGRALILQAGDCAERFTETASTEARAQLVETLADRLMTATGLPVVTIGRMAGQYPKPRSSPTEKVPGPDGPLTVPTYRGDLVNAPEPDSRDPDPDRLVEGYHRATATLALLRARSASADTRAATDVFVSHEALLLPFEEALTRYDGQSRAWYSTSAHLLWIGDRTRGLDQAHVEYLRGIANPVAVKLGPTTTADDVVALCQRLDPERLPGRLTLITRMGARQVGRLLPEMIEAMTRAGHPVTWVCDPMHANTTTTAAGLKTRHLDTMLAEVQQWLAAHRGAGSHPGGLHLEVTCDNVTECVGGRAGAVDEAQVHQHFLSACDPRLNPEQATELVLQTGRRLTGHRHTEPTASTPPKASAAHWRPYAQDRRADLTAAATSHTWTTPGCLEITRTAQPYPHHALDQVTAALDERPGGVLGSSVQQPGRYRRWRIGYLAPCLEVTAAARRMDVRALNERGRVLLPIVTQALSASGHLISTSPSTLTLAVPAPDDVLPEEQRSRRAGVFSALRALLAAFAAPDDAHLGLYGAFGYDLAFGFEPIALRLPRPDDHRDLVLHLPDELYVEDESGLIRYRYDFTVGDTTTAGLPRDSDSTRPAARPAALPPPPGQGAYAKIVRTAQERFMCGDLVEVVPSQVMYASCTSASDFYSKLRRRNPAPYELLFNLGGVEHLAGTSPEMYVRVTRDDHGRLWVETCPISGTVRRGRDAVEDSDHIRALLNSRKDESELTMCTDVDRNDKARICDPGSVQILGRRQIEMYSRLIHTVDHVQGRLRPGFDALDAFLTHMWAVTVTGAPKRAAMQFIEDHEQSPRRWYGGAVGVLRFDGTLDSGLTLRTAQIHDGLAAVRVGATLLHDSDPDAEERETQVKAQALMETLTGAPPATQPEPPLQTEATPMRVLLIDHSDSFVHTLADYFRQAGAHVTTLRAGLPPATLDELAPDLVVLSPGPGRPGDHGCLDLLDEITARGLPAFGVCLGLQAMVEHSGGTVVPLPQPAHGRPGNITVHSGRLLAGLPAQFTAGRYHSLHAVQVPDCYEISATTDDGVVMAIEHRHAPRWAVQFHPESLMTTDHHAGHRIITNILHLGRVSK